MPRSPLDEAVAESRRVVSELSARLDAEKAKLEALIESARRLRDEYVENALREHSPSVNTDREQMQLDNRIAISKGRSAGSKDPFFAAIRAAKPKGFTLRSLATRIGCEASLLSMQRKGDRPIPMARAKLIEELTGWPADKKHWPGGLS